MFRRALVQCSRSSGAFARTLPALQHGSTPGHLPQAWDFIENKIEDKDIHSAFDPPGTVSLTLTRQDEFIMKTTPVRGVQLATVSGELGIRAGHEYKIAKLVPGVISVEKAEGQPLTSYFTAGGFAHINSDGQVDINTVECIPLDEFEPAFVDKELLKANDVLRSAKTEKEKAIAEISVSVYEALQSALKTATN